MSFFSIFQVPDLVLLLKKIKISKFHTSTSSLAFLGEIIEMLHRMPTRIDNQLTFNIKLWKKSENPIDVKPKPDLFIISPSLGWVDSVHYVAVNIVSMELTEFTNTFC